MSVVEFKESITPSELFKWRSISESIVSDNLITIYPGGIIEYGFIPLNAEDKFITSKYRLLIKYNSNEQNFSNGITCLFDMVMLTEGSLTESTKYQTIGVRALSTDESDTCDVIFNTKGGEADSFIFRLRNNGDSTIKIESIELFPSYKLDDDTVTIVQEMLPTITHASNLNHITVQNKEINVIKLKTGTSEDTSLSIHCLINGWASDPTTVILRILMNDIALQFSPIKIDVPQGNFLISVPACVMRVKNGGNELKVIMQSTNGVVHIEPEKIQCSLEGKGLIQGGGSARPGAYITERHKLKVIDLDRKLKYKNGNVNITIQQPKKVILADVNKLLKDNKTPLFVKTSLDIELNHER